MGTCLLEPAAYLKRVAHPYSGVLFYRLASLALQFPPQSPEAIRYRAILCNAPWPNNPTGYLKVLQVTANLQQRGPGFGETVDPERKNDLHILYQCLPGKVKTLQDASNRSTHTKS